MDLLDYLKYILPLTIVFDACVSLFLIRKSFSSKIIRLYFLALVTLVAWEIFFWIGIFTNYGNIGNDLIDRITFIFGLLSPYLLMIFLMQYAGSKFSRYVSNALGSIVAIFMTTIALFGIGQRHYSGIETYHYSLGADTYASIVLSFYSVIVIMIAMCCLYILFTMIRPGLSVLETARRKLMRNSILFSILVTLLPCTVLPLVVMSTGNYLTEMLASDWYISMIVFAAIGSSIWTAATAYALTRYRLFDVTVKIRRSLLLTACLIALVATMYCLNVFLFRPYLGETQQSLALALYAAGALGVMVWCTRTAGTGDPISFAVLEPIHPDITVQKLVEKLHDYMYEEFETQSDAIYVLDINSKQYVQSQTGVIVNLSAEILKILQTGMILNQNIPNSLKPAKAIIPLMYNGVLIGLIAISKPVEAAIQKSLQPFSELLYQTLFAHFLRSV